MRCVSVALSQNMIDRRRCTTLSHAASWLIIIRILFKVNSGQTMILINKRFHTDDGTDMIPQFTVVDSAHEDVKANWITRLDRKLQNNSSVFIVIRYPCNNSIMQLNLYLPKWYTFAAVTAFELTKQTVNYWQYIDQYQAYWQSILNKYHFLMARYKEIREVIHSGITIAKAKYKALYLPPFQLKQRQSPIANKTINWTW